MRVLCSLCFFVFLFGYVVVAGEERGVSPFLHIIFRVVVVRGLDTSSIVYSCCTPTPLFDTRLFRRSCQSVLLTQKKNEAQSLTPSLYHTVLLRRKKTGAVAYSTRRCLFAGISRDDTRLLGFPLVIGKACAHPSTLALPA